MKILVAEDNRVNQKLIEAVLKKLNIHHEIVENGQLAVERIQQQTFDLILMDCQMPILDGYEATAQIRKIANFANLPIIALTADVDVKSKQHAIEVGFTAHLAKPLNIETLKRILQQHLLS